MTLRRIRILLWLTTSGLLVLAGGVVGLHWVSPPQITTSDSSWAKNGDAGSPPTENTASPDLNRAELKQVASRHLRQRLFDPPVVAPKPPPPKSLSKVELISTILRNQGEASAWVRDGATTRKVSIGDSVGPENNPAKVIAIHADRIILEHESGEAEVTRDGATAGRGSR